MLEQSDASQRQKRNSHVEHMRKTVLQTIRSVRRGGYTCMDDFEGSAYGAKDAEELHHLMTGMLIVARLHSED